MITDKVFVILLFRNTKHTVLNKMRIKKISVLGACAIFMLSSCGEKKSNVNVEALRTEQQQAVAGTPYAEPELKNSSTAKLGGRTYQITVERRADTSLPVVTDELGNRFYDNRVEVSILRDGQSFLQRSYTKDAFSDFLSASDKQGTVLLGMAFDADRSDSRAIRLGAQIGQVGVEEGPAFVVEIPLGGGAPSIVRDSNQDTTGDDGMED